jgi:glutamate dehydrogenase (NADP+)
VGTCAGKYLEGEKPWRNVKEIDIAMPCATQNEIDAKDAQALIDAGMKLLVEGANMPTCSDAIELLHEHGIEFGPAKACNAGMLPYSVTTLQLIKFRNQRGLLDLS